MVQSGCAFVAGIHPSGTWISKSFESMQWSACVHRLDLSSCSHPKEFWGNVIRTYVNSKGKNPLYRRLRGGSNLWHCITQDSKPNTLLTELFWPPGTDWFTEDLHPAYVTQLQASCAFRTLCIFQSSTCYGFLFQLVDLHSLCTQ